MREEKLNRFLSYSLIVALCLVSSSASYADDPQAIEDRSPDVLKAKLDEAEKSFKDGRVDDAVKQATALLGVKDSSFFQSDAVAREAKADLVVFQLKAGNADRSASLISELLRSLQLELPMDPRYASNTADVLAESIQTLKSYFAGVVNRLNEKDETKQIIDSLIDNSVPKDYREQLKTYCARMDAIGHELADFKTVADTEELSYGDSLTDLGDPIVENKSDPKLSADKLEKLDKALLELSDQARQLPIADARASLEIYRLALVANSAQRYWQAELFAQQALSRLKALSNGASGFPDVKIALGYALVKQGKKKEFNDLKDELLKNFDNRERVLVSLARLCEANGENSEAVSVYNRILESRKEQRNSQVPEWMDKYNSLLKSLAPNCER